MKKCAICFWLAMSAAHAFSSQVSLTRARDVAQAWMDARRTVPAQVDGVKTLYDSDRAPLCHAVRWKGGGFVIMAADDRLPPILAISSGSDFVADTRNPLWAMLSRDIASRMRYLERSDGANRQSGRAWSNLSSRTAMDGAGLPSADGIDDVRVAPLVRSTWDQGDIEGKSVYNYYTPSGTPCGCVATAAAQVMRYHEHPRCAVGNIGFPCSVRGRSQTLTTYGGVYDWSLMPLNPGGEISDVQREMIGRLAFDVGVASQMSYSADGSGTIAYYTEKSLVSVFSYGQAVYAERFDGDTGVLGQIPNIVLANLDAGFPVLMGISGKDVATKKSVGHEIVGDGYGYLDGELFVHLNLGWSGNWDAWYNLPRIDTHEGRSGCAFDLFDDVVYNIFPTGTFEIISGRVVDEAGGPIAGAVVRAVDKSGETEYEVSTTRCGVYALRVSPNATYSVVATDGAKASDAISVSVGKSQTHSAYFDDVAVSDLSLSVGNRWGNVLTVSTERTPDPVLSQPGCSFLGKMRVECACPDAGAEIRYTTDGSAPTADGLPWPDGGLEICSPVTLKVCAFKEGARPSSVVTACYSDRPAVTLDAATLTWNPVAGATCYRIYRSTNRFGCEIAACSDWISATSIALPPACETTPVFYFVRASTMPDERYATPLSDAVTQALHIGYIDRAGGELTLFDIRDFPATVGKLYYRTSGSFGALGRCEVWFPNETVGCSVPEQGEGVLKSTKITTQKFGQLRGELCVSDCETEEPRFWESTFFIVRGGITNYLDREELDAEPISFSFYQQCAPSLVLSCDEIASLSRGTNHFMDITCPREHQWSAEATVSWISLERSQGRGSCWVRLDICDNPDEGPRTGTVTVRCGDIVRRVLVSQSGAQGVPSGDDPAPGNEDEDVAIDSLRAGMSTNLETVVQAEVWAVEVDEPKTLRATVARNDDGTARIALSAIYAGTATNVVRVYAGTAGDGSKRLAKTIFVRGIGAQDRRIVLSAGETTCMNCDYCQESQWLCRAEPGNLVSTSLSTNFGYGTSLTVTAGNDAGQDTIVVARETGSGAVDAYVIHVTVESAQEPKPTTSRSSLTSIRLRSGRGGFQTCVHLNWDLVEDAEHYTIYRATVADFAASQPLIDVSRQCVDYLDSAVVPGLDYYYWLVATLKSGATCRSMCSRGWSKVAVAPQTQSIALKGSGGTERIEVLSNVKWETHSSAPWLKIEEIDTERNGVFDITADANLTASPRSAEVSVVGGGDTGHAVTNTVAITQEPKGCLSKADAKAVPEQAADSGADPTVRLVIVMVDGNPVVSWHSDLSKEEQGCREYTVYGTSSLGADRAWKPVDLADPNAVRDMRFFKVISVLRSQISPTGSCR